MAAPRDANRLIKMLAVFDNDGTICDTQEVEGWCFTKAIEGVTGQSLATVDWSKYEEPTSSAIVQDLLSGDPLAKEKEQHIEDEFVRLLRADQPKWPGDFTPIAGAVEFIARLKQENLCEVAIATGCFEASARFKLQCCGIDINAFPHATSSDTPQRRDIITLAASRAGFELESVIYLGDALWDLRVSRELNIPMIGMGRRYDTLQMQGVPDTFRDYSEPERIISALLAIARSKGMREGK
jgi:phosphoglycolate phosphatase-like HAD superfamily hydrolase